MKACALVGAQFGSEGKGLIAAHIAAEYGTHVRVGAANAGHTLYTLDGRNYEPGQEHMAWEKHVMQQVPCAAYANPRAVLVVGPGALISPEIFYRELVQLDRWREELGLSTALVYVDPRAHVITEFQIADEATSGLEERIGSTSATAREGIGQAQADRVMREARCVTAGDYYGAEHDLNHESIVLKESPQLLYGQEVLLEGTQGTGLSLTTGYFPYTTSRNTTAAGLCADAGFAPTALDRVILVARTYPIRVAGNSGPFGPDSVEIDWSEIGVNPENERTTVTKKVRRVATFSFPQLYESVVLNGATEIALTFADYEDPDIAGESGKLARRHLKSDNTGLYEFIERIHDVTGVLVTMLGTGPHSVLDLVD